MRSAELDPLLVIALPGRSPRAAGRPRVETEGPSRALAGETAAVVGTMILLGAAREARARGPVAAADTSMTSKGVRREEEKACVWLRPRLHSAKWVAHSIKMYVAALSLCAHIHVRSSVISINNRIL
mmetsp:Transcript_11429/g.24111  ORF Transcript_11429/g.24111 Transcript_11429/m.24111 type:complete len:127 (-) Transcript_11429:32-412(-)